MDTEKKADKSVGRNYSSPFREQQAIRTRQKIMDSAARLLCSHGYNKMTIAALAQDAGVAPQTVYAIFGSKTGVLSELIDQMVFAPDLSQLFNRVSSAQSAEEVLQIVAQLCCQIYTSLNPIYEVLCGTSAVAPELAEMERLRQEQRRENMREPLKRLVALGAIRKDLETDEALDILWAYSGRELYKMMVCDREWSWQAYKKWLTANMRFALLDPAYIVKHEQGMACEYVEKSEQGVAQMRASRHPAA